MSVKAKANQTKHSEQFIKETLEDYLIANQSRQLSVLGRKEVLTGKAKFGIFGDGKEVAQVAMARSFQNGDWRSGYYRDQTFMLATGMFSLSEFFAQLYGDTDMEANPSNAGRSFNNHFGTRNIDENGDWKNLVEQKNSSSDISPTAGQMPRLVGLAYASKLYRNIPELKDSKQFSINGNEVAFGTIGDSSSAEGHFWESINAAAVLEIPMAMSVWDDGFGISVPAKYQIAKQNISEVLSGFEKKSEDSNGIRIYKAKGWDYLELLETYKNGVAKIREDHVPALFHINEVTQPQGHSTSGSHERYKSPERLQFEKDFDPLKKMREWILEENIATAEELDTLEKQAVDDVKEAKKQAWKNFTEPIRKERDALLDIIDSRSCYCQNDKVDKVGIIADNLRKVMSPIRKDNFSAAKRILRHVCADCSMRKQLQSELSVWLKDSYEDARHRYNTKLHCETDKASINVNELRPDFGAEPVQVPGREILRDNFDKLFEMHKNLVTFGEDTGGIGGVNQSLEGLQEKYGVHRITDTGIRETTILGQGIGLALRGIRPIVEIQYFDYLLYALQTLSDDLATLHWRTSGGQKAPVIIRTRGHRLEGIWHSGSPLSMVINSIRGVYVCVPRNMTQAAGVYNTLLEGDDPALVIEPLNGYRLKETKPQNLGEFKTPLGVPEIMEEGKDVTLVTYGSCVRIAQEAVRQLKEFDIHVELIDVQTLLPFDKNHMILESVKKTNKVVFFDEDVPGGATAFMMKKVLEDQKAYFHLDSEPRTITAQEHRPAYATDGDYFSNPNAENVFETIYDLMHESNPSKYRKLY